MDLKTITAVMAVSWLLLRRGDDDALQRRRRRMRRARAAGRKSRYRPPLEYSSKEWSLEEWGGESPVLVKHTFRFPPLPPYLIYANYSI